MTYVLRPDESFPKAFNRIAREEIAFAIDLLAREGAAPEAVHQTRKAIKRLRALLRLARPSMNDDRFKRENARLRAAANALSGARDAEVMLMTLEALGKRTGEKGFNKMTEGFRAWLTERRDKQVEALDAARIEATIKRIKEAGTSLAEAKLSKVKEFGLPAGLQLMFGDARDNFIAAYHGGAHPDAFHDYRKSVQLYHRQMQLLLHVWPELMNVYIDAAKQLADNLGVEHDLSVMNEAVTSHRKLFPDRERMEHLSALIDSWQQELRRQAFVDGGRLFLSEKPRAFARRMITYLENSQIKPSDV